jgi:hypothetical protein
MDENPKTAELTAGSFHDAIETVLDGAAALEQIPRRLDYLLTVIAEIGGTEHFDLTL